MYGISYSYIWWIVLSKLASLANCVIWWYHGHMSRLMTKPTKWHMRPVKTQILLGIRPVWSESLLSAWIKLGSLAAHWSDTQADLSLRLAHTSFCWFVKWRLILLQKRIIWLWRMSYQDNMITYCSKIQSAWEMLCLRCGICSKIHPTQRTDRLTTWFSYGLIMK